MDDKFTKWVYFLQYKTKRGLCSNEKAGSFSPAGVDPKVYAPGSTFIFLPFLNDWHTFNINLQNMEMSAQIAKGDMYGEDDLRFKTIDGNDIGLDLIISYRVIPEKAPYVVANVAQSDLELRQNVVRVIARSLPRDIL